MQPLQFLVPIRALESLSGILGFVIFGLVIVNLLTRHRAHQVHVKQAREGDGDERMKRYTPHTASNFALILLSFLFMIIHPHGGMVLSVLVLGMFISDIFEFESRKVEARNDLEIDRPKGALVASVVVFLYAAYQSVFFVIEPLWNAII